MAKFVEFFAYGSNMNQAYLKTWLVQHGARPDGIRSATPASLADHRVAFNFLAPTWGACTANLVKAKGETVHGVLMEIDEPTLQKFEQKEGAPRTYQRVKVSVTDDRGKSHPDAHALVAPPERCKDGPPKKKYLDLVVKGAEDFQLPADYVAKLKAVKTVD